jgi:hypothetical protein
MHGKEGDVISKLEALKRKSIQSEDYDTAKNVKQEIEVKRRELQTIIQKQGFYYDSATNEMMLDASAAAHFAKPIVMAENSGNAAFEQLDSTVTAASAVLDEYHQKSPDNGKLKRATEAIEAPYPAVTARNETPAAEKNLPLEDRPIKPLKQSISLEEFDANSVPPGIETSATAANGDKAPAKPKPAAVKAKLQNVSEKPLAGATVRGKAAVEEKPAAPPAPENPLLFCPPPSISFEDTNPQFDEMNYRSTISLFESPFVNCLCSKDFQAREWAFNYADERLVKAKQLAGKSLADEAAFRKAVPKAQVDLIVRSMYEILYHGLEDSREKVTLRSLQLWRNLIGNKN